MIPARYPVVPLARGGYRARTRQNVVDSDGTVILFDSRFTGGVLTGGTRLAREFAEELTKPCQVIDAAHVSSPEAGEAIAKFVQDYEILQLNVAGPRASEWPDGYAFALHAVTELLLR